MKKILELSSNKGSCIWAEFEECLKTAGNIAFWWRDDDVSAREPKFIDLPYLKYKYRLGKMLSLLSKYNIPSVFAVIPKDFSRWGTTLAGILKKYNVYIALHGINHVNNSADNTVTEFPDDCNVEAAVKIILEHQKDFSDIFGNNLLPVFVPPFNNICEQLESELLKRGFTAVSKSNMGLVKHDAHNIDIDFVNWRTRALKDEEAILKEIITLIRRGVKVIGLNAHHSRVRQYGFKFFNKLFATVEKFNNVEWIMPFDNTAAQAKAQRKN
ncbi:MAG: hypothetical protein LBK53_09310 [Heliobacteriaceae bacterium]|jgi:predicted deacetylase|nr:hypothetical protein [Heliobacteriaceae bacterium]